MDGAMVEEVKDQIIELIGRRNRLRFVKKSCRRNCSGCHSTIQKVERQGQVALAKVNIDENPHLAGQYGIQSIPTVIAFRGGQPVLDFMGLLPEAQLREFLDRILPTEADRLAQQAAGLEKTAPDEAEGLATIVGALAAFSISLVL